ncbi:enoyl-CoA hydratase/isomerase family protein [Ascoidea rubescens DSM 1968]|uniref:ClpP/crotonase n=1 Tax=Ascoidea rubescens DSM 1968 TaxID=1344418 RepID=A0A1D2VHP5_9ASCO|nr:ClpP/crotonase [Ascoidea rubescens DSM 1968]ODV61191.1 ClpP/crotonase [Ascoidea rubescens DSM 1968]
MGQNNSLSNRILYQVKGKISIITLNQPDKLNALGGDDYTYLAKLMEKSNKDPSTVITLINSSGRYFSSGADYKFIKKYHELINDKKNDEKEIERQNDRFWFNDFIPRNSYLTDCFINHGKIIVACLNGPAIGLSAAMVALSDIIYSKNDDTFLLYPFTKIGLVTEGSTSYSLLLRLGLSRTNEALLLSKPIYNKDLVSCGFVNKCYNMDDYNKKDQVEVNKSTEKFNELILNELSDSVKFLNGDSIKDIKKLINSNIRLYYNSANSKEVIQGYKKWLTGVPQRQFINLANKNIKHKL